LISYYSYSLPSSLICPCHSNQKLYSGGLAKARRVVEHTFFIMKEFRVMGEEFRNRLRHYDMITDIVSSLVKLRIMGA
jgi:hypothetical protein